MDLKNTRALGNWIRSGASLDEVERASPTGLVGNQRFDADQAVRAYRLLWTWAAPRFAGHAGQQQQRYFDKCGAGALARREARARAWMAKLS